MFKVHIIASGSAGNACVLSTGKTSILIDCGIPPAKLREYTSLNKISAIMVTHEHKDHAKYALKLARELYIPLIASQGTHSCLVGDFPSTLRLSVTPGQKYHYGDFTFIPFKVYHDAKEPLGFFFGNDSGETVLFCSDTGTMDGIKANAGLYILEVNHDEDYLIEQYDKGLMSQAHYFRLLGKDGHMSTQIFRDYLENYIPEDRVVILHHTGSIGDIDWGEIYPKREIIQLEKGMPNFTYEYGTPVCPF